ncbi:MAG: HNH endonuclease signature motif containing protein [Saprospiraceae bacterium]
MKNIEHFGLLASITWNSNRWQKEPTEEDIVNSHYDHVPIYKITHDALNFAHKTLPLEPDGMFKGYTPSFSKRYPSEEKLKTLKLLFLISTNYGENSGRYIVGIYGFPVISSNLKREVEHPLYRKYTYVNIMSKVEDIAFLDDYVKISDDIARSRGIIPYDKNLSKQGWNYLDFENTHNLLGYLLEHNPQNAALKRLLKKLNLKINPPKPDGYYESNANTIKGIGKNEEDLLTRTPSQKERISKYIERGSIADQIKEQTGFRCLVCEALNVENPKGFQKDKGGYYIEAHHVIPVAKQEKGSLHPSNIITVCATHHRQFHYGKVVELEHTPETFHFIFDGQKISIPKIVITPKQGK